MSKRNTPGCRMSEKIPGSNLEFVREDDHVEYFVFPQLPTECASSLDVVETQLETLQEHLDGVLSQCKAIAERYVRERNYIWHKDEFHLRVRTGAAQERVLNDEIKEDAEVLPPHLHGVTHFGDQIADEWFVVYLLHAITRELSGSIARVVDSDGEFLLIEAAEVLPKWANPDTCEQRVYISDGTLQLVQNSSSKKTELITVGTAISRIQLNPTMFRVSSEIQECINERLKDFNGPNTTLHRQVVHLPIGVASLLKEHPKLIAPAVRAFCERDPIDMKACRTMRFFPPEHRVRMNVCFTRCLYAMLMQSNYVPDRKIGWNLTGAVNTEEYKEDLLGIKLACGFEILASQAKDAGEEENDPAWRGYLRSLMEKGYFRENLEGSEEYKRLLNEAKSYFKQNNERFLTAPIVGRNILQLLRTLDISADQLHDEENNVEPSESDDWLNITVEELDAMLMDRYGPKKLYKPNGDINAEEFTRNLSQFLERQSTFEGIDNDSDDADESAMSSSRHKQDFKNKVKKNNSMRKACKQNSVIDKSKNTEDDCNTHVRNFLDFVIPEDKWDSNSDMSDYEDEDDLERNIESMTNADCDIDADIQAYMAQMDKELAKTKIGHTFGNRSTSRKTTAGNSSSDDDFDDIETFKPIDINVNALKNMMESYKSQLGGAGPVSNLLNAMGAGMSTAATTAEQNDDVKESTV